MARMAASPRLTIARRLKGTVKVTAYLCDRDHPPSSGGGVVPPGQPHPYPPYVGVGAREPGSGARACCAWVGMTFERQELELHGQRVSYRVAGSGPALLLLHGIANSSDTWARVAPLLSERFTVIAPDLLGHGESAAPRGDYSLGAHASGARDVATALGHERVTVVGHSLGGGIAMQFAYQFPERTERLVLVSSGGLGRDVHMLLRAASLPGADYVLPALTSQRLVELGRDARRPARARGAAPERGHRRARARLRGARQRRVAPGLPADPAGGRRARRPAGQREQPARARRHAAVADRVGPERLDHPGRARRHRPPGDAGQPLRRLRGRRPHAPGGPAPPLRLRAHRVRRDDRARAADPRPLAAAAGGGA